MSEGGASTCSVHVSDGQVIFTFPMEVKWVAFDPETARQIGESMARAAYRARFGSQPQVNKSHLVDQIRTRLHTSATHMIRSMIEKRELPGRIAQAVVDHVLSEVT